MPLPYRDLEKVFHEPSRLAIVSELAARAEGCSFPELKRLCELTDGNLSRHLATLEKGGVVHIDKSFVDAKPRTTVTLTEAGRKGFLDYLNTLEQVLKEAAEHAHAAKRKRGKQ